MTVQGAYFDTASLPQLNTHTREFLDDPNSLLGAGPDRVTFARGVQGVEVFPYDWVRGLFRDRRIVPRDPAYFERLGVPKDSHIMSYLVEGNVNLTWPENHDRLRPILVKGFTPRRIEAARPMIREIANDLIDKMLARGSADFVRDFSHHLSIGVISRFLGVDPEDIPLFENATVDQRLLGQIPLEPVLPQLNKSLGTVADYSARLVARRRAKRANDFISDLIEAQEGGDKLTEAQLVWSIAGMLLAGHDTTRYQIGSAVRCLVESGQWDALVTRPDLIPSAVNESMRIYPAVPRQVKLLDDDMEIGGERFRKADIVVLNLAAAGRDPAAFPDPGKFDLHRAEASWYDIGFGYGAHYCIGIALAKAEMCESLALLTQRLRNVRFAGEIEVKPVGVICGPDSMPITFEARPTN